MFGTITANSEKLGALDCTRVNVIPNDNAIHQKSAARWRLKKYRGRVKRGTQDIDILGVCLQIRGLCQQHCRPIRHKRIYALNPMWLLANGFMASENTGTTNELLVDWWYVSQLNLDLGDIRRAKSKTEAI